MSKKIPLLIADDDRATVLTITKLIEMSYDDFNILNAFTGDDAWRILKQEKPGIAILDMQMPGKSGYDLTKLIRSDNDLKNILIIILTGADDHELRKKTLDAGADDYMNKPVFSDILMARLNTAIRILDLQFQLIEENTLLMDLADELEEEIQDMVKLSVKFMQARIPASEEMLKRVAHASIWMAKELGGFEPEELRDIEIAAFLSQCGRIFLPDNLLRTPIMTNGVPTDKLMSQVPISGKEIVSSVKRFSEVAKIIHHIYENFDGSGIPDKLQSWQIPLPSRIIRVALDYEDIREQTRSKPREVLEKLRRESQRLYDMRPVVLMEHYVKSHDKDEFDPNEKAVQLVELTEGMILTRDIYTEKGLKLLPSGAVLKESAIDKIISHNTSDPILGNIFVKK